MKHKPFFACSKLAVCFTVMLALLFSVIPTSAFAASETATQPADSLLEYDLSALTVNNLPDYLAGQLNINNIDPSAALAINTYGYRQTQETVLEPALSLTDAQRLDGLTVINTDGTKTSYSFGTDIKYIDGSSIKFIDNELIPELNLKNGKIYGYRTKSSNNLLYLPSNIKKGLLFESGNLSLTLTPVISNNTQAELIQIGDPDAPEYALEYKDTYAQGIDLQYLSVYGGFKENIIINQYNGISSFNYKLKLSGYTARLVDDGKRIAFYAENSQDNEPAYVFGQPFAQDANGNITNDCGYTLTQKGNSGNYELTLWVDQEFLSDPNTAYPVTVDPPLSVSRGSVEDVTVCSDGTTDSTSGSLIVGTDDNLAEYAAYIKCNFLWYFRHLRPEDVVSASFATGFFDGTPGIFNCGVYDSNQILNINTVNFSQLTAAQGEYVSFFVAAPIYSYADFTITPLMRKWLKHYLNEDGGKNPDYGFILRSSNTSGPDNMYFYSADSSHSIYPYFSITYNEQQQLEDGYYYIKNKQYDTYLSYSDTHTNVFTDEFSIYNTDRHAIKWLVQKKENTEYGEIFYTITPENYSDKALGTYGYDPYTNQNNAQLNTQYSSLSTSNYWRIIMNADGSFRVIPAFSTMQSLTADNSGEYNSYTYEYYGWDSMKWEFEALTTGIGAAPELQLLGINGPDCFGYALNFNFEVNMYMQPYDTIDVMKIEAVSVAAQYGIILYEIEAYDSPIRIDEYRICMRVGTQVLFSTLQCDYHFMKQVYAYDETGNSKVVLWADKKAWLPMREERDVHTEDPATLDWPILGEYERVIMKNFYDSNTVFFAVRKLY